MFSLARMQNPARDGLGNDHDRECDTEDHPKEDLKMRSVHGPHAFVVCFVRDTRECSPASGETAQSYQSADNGDYVKYVMVSGRARVLFKHIAEAKIAGPRKGSTEHSPPDERRCFSLADCVFELCHKLTKNALFRKR